MPNYTTEELIQFLYLETPVEKTRAISQALATDYALKEKYDALLESKRSLDTLVSSPRQQSIMAILNYARNTVEVEQP